MATAAGRRVGYKHSLGMFLPANSPKINPSPFPNPLCAAHSGGRLAHTLAVKGTAHRGSLMRAPVIVIALLLTVTMRLLAAETSLNCLLTSPAG
jgi:hypothetical protein